MVCTVYENMCDRCRFHYLKLRQKGQPSGHLEYKKGTYPVVFKCDIRPDIPIPRKSRLNTDYGPLVLENLKKDLANYFKEQVEVYEESRYDANGGIPAVSHSLLIDFPYKILQPEQWKAWLSEFFRIRICEWDERSHTLRPKAYYTAASEAWQTFRPGDENHPCWARLEWFLEKERIVPFI
ncbi:hypothetical protein BDW62DRAFT_202996 [Aspergillus aurantiobrunneus]